MSGKREAVTPGWRPNQAGGFVRVTLSGRRTHIASPVLDSDPKVWWVREAGSLLTYDEISEDRKVPTFVSAEEAMMSVYRTIEAYNMEAPLKESP